MQATVVGAIVGALKTNPVEGALADTLPAADGVHLLQPHVTVVIDCETTDLPRDNRPQGRLSELAEGHAVVVATGWLAP